MVRFDGWMGRVGVSEALPTGILHGRRHLGHGVFALLYQVQASDQCVSVSVSVTAVHGIGYVLGSVSGKPCGVQYEAMHWL